MFEALGISAKAIRLPEQLEGVQGLVIPGGESTAISKLMHSYDFFEAIRTRHEQGMPVWGTCAGAILVASDAIDALEDQEFLGLMDMTVRRNAYGRQIDSFEVDIPVRHVHGGPFRGVFIRAPWIEEVREGVEVLAVHDGHAIAARDTLTLATAFHPELTGDPRMHRFFINEFIGPVEDPDTGSGRR